MATQYLNPDASTVALNGNEGGLGHVPQSDPEGEVYSGDSGDGSTTTTPTDLTEWPPETVATAVIEVLDIVVTRAYRAPLSYVEKATLDKAFVPLAKKYMAGSVPVEYVALGALAMVVLPRHLARPKHMGSLDDSSGAGSEGGGQESAFADTGVGPTSEMDGILSRSS